MNCEVRSSKCEARLPIFARSMSSPHSLLPLDNRHSKIVNPRRRGSVLVLVMTLLGILFVLGVAFLASMNFEAGAIAVQRDRDRADRGVTGTSLDVGSMLRDSMMAGAGVPFGDSTSALSASTFAEMPGVQNSFSPIEPIRTVGPDNTFGNGDDEIMFTGYFDAKAAKTRPFAGPSLPPGFSIDSRMTNDSQLKEYSITLPGATSATWINLRRCAGGPRKGLVCDLDDECQLNVADPPFLCEGVRVADADGDGVADAVLVDAADVGITGTQFDELAGRVNPADNPSGRVSVALRVIPHGGLVNLNDSHPNLIRDVLGLPTWSPPSDPNNADPSLGDFIHRPSLDPTLGQSLYSPLLEESSLRRRGFLPPRVIPASRLHGNALLDPTKEIGGLADMAWYLYPLRELPGAAAQGNFESVYSTSGMDKSRGHRFWPISPPDESFAGDLNYNLWPVRMEPFTSSAAAADIPSRRLPEYDRRHLVTTVSHDDLFARGGTVGTPNGNRDIRELMIEANQSAWDPNGCPPLLPFEYADYPTHLRNETDPRLVSNPAYESCDCPTSLFCRVDPRKGRLQLSLPWIDDQLAAAAKISDLKLREEARQRVYHTIHDVFFLLVRNAAARTKVEGMSCASDLDCPVRDTVCLLRGAVPPSGQRGYCVHRGNPDPSFTEPSKPTGPGCAMSADCAIDGSICIAGVCELAAPAWRDKECFFNSDCDPPGGSAGEQFCLITTAGPPPRGVCADRWTRQLRSEAMISRTAASLTANMIDFADADDVPSRVAIRDLEFTTKCLGGTNHYLPCSVDADCPSGACRNLTGRDIDLDPDTDGVQGIYVYGLERQPYITEVATLADDTNPLVPLVGRAVEILNPYAQSILANNAANNEEYFLYEVDPGLPLSSAHIVPLTGLLQGTAGTPPQPFTTFYSADDDNRAADLFGGTVPAAGAVRLNGLDALKFKNGWHLYLVRRAYYPGDVNPTDIVVDQFLVKGDNLNLIGKESTDVSDSAIPPPALFLFSVGRVVKDFPTLWTATVGVQREGDQEAATLGNWNVNLPDPTLHPVEIQFANTGNYGPRIISTTFVNAAFPTTGSLSLLMRHANRSINDSVPPSTPPPGLTTVRVENLAFTTALNKIETPTLRAESPPGSGIYPSFPDLKIENTGQIDNGRLPLFDTGKDFGGVIHRQYAHHLPPQMFKRWDPVPHLDPTDPLYGLTTTNPLPGDLNTLPWGQLVFDYFTALPLSNPGPYVGVPDLDGDGNPDIGLPESQPRVDRDGARVHGRINLNAAPWTVLSGLPLVPMNRFPLDVRQRVAERLEINPADYGVAYSIGPELAQAIVAYREARALSGADPANWTGSYGDGLPATGISPTANNIYPRGWTSVDPAARRGTGFMGIGELANVRHPGAFVANPPTTFPYRVDYQVIDPGASDKNAQNFIDAAAVLIALGDWVTVRSQVFTVYGQIRGEPAAGSTNPVQDADSRAIRFQETIDRLPTLFGEPVPRRIGERAASKLTDIYND